MLRFPEKLVCYSEQTIPTDDATDLKVYQQKFSMKRPTAARQQTQLTVAMSTVVSVREYLNEVTFGTQLA